MATITSLVALAAACCISACTQAGCVIKRNISSSGERIYHVPGQRYYDKTLINWLTGERWFCTEQNAGSARSKKPSLPVGEKRRFNFPEIGALNGSDEQVFGEE